MYWKVGKMLLQSPAVILDYKAEKVVSKSNGNIIKLGNYYKLGRYNLPGDRKSVSQNSWAAQLLSQL